MEEHKYKLYPIQGNDITNIKKIRCIIKEKEQLNTFMDTQNNSLLQKAILQGCCNSVVKHLINNGASCEHANDNGETCLHLACRNKTNRKIVKLILLKNPELVGVSDKNGVTAIHICCGLADLKLLVILLSNVNNPADFINKQDCNGNTALHILCQSEAPNTLCILKLLLKYDGDTNIVNSSGDLALHLACEHQSTETVSYMLSCGGYCEVNIRNSVGRTPLHCCVFNKPKRSKWIFTQLFKYIDDEDLTIRDNFGQLALKCALVKDVKIVASFLTNAIKKDNDVLLLELADLKDELSIDEDDALGNNLLREACRTENYSLAEYLFKELGADVNKESKDIQTIVHKFSVYTFVTDYIAVFKVQSEKCKRYSRDDFCQSELEVIFMEGNVSQLSQLLQVIEDNSKVLSLLGNRDIVKNNSENSLGNTLLHYASYFALEKITWLLLQRNCKNDVNFKNNNGETALHQVSNGNGSYCEYRYSNQNVRTRWNTVTKQLIRAGADIYSQTKNGKTALDLAFLTANNHALSAIIQSIDPEENTRLYDVFCWIKDMNRHNTLHRTVLTACCEHQAPLNIIRMLLEKGADHTLKDRNGSRPDQIAIRAGNIDLLLLLHQCSGANKHENPHKQKSNYLLQLACNYLDIDNEKHKRVFDYLITNKTAVYYDQTKLEDIFISAIKHGKKLSLIKFSLRCGVDVNCLTKSGYDRVTPLHITCIGVYLNIMCMPLLISHGARISALNSKGLTPAELYLKHNPADYKRDDRSGVHDSVQVVNILVSAGTRQINCDKVYTSPCSRRPQLSAEQRIVKCFSCLMLDKDTFSQVLICLKLLGVSTSGLDYPFHLYDYLLQSPLDLRNLSAHVIRTNLKPNAWVSVKYLNLPTCLKNYITMDHHKYL